MGHRQRYRTKNGQTRRREPKMDRLGKRLMMKKKLRKRVKYK